MISFLVSISAIVRIWMKKTNSFEQFEQTILNNRICFD